MLGSAERGQEGTTGAKNLHPSFRFCNGDFTVLRCESDGIPLLSLAADRQVICPSLEFKQSVKVAVVSCVTEQAVAHVDELPSPLDQTNFASDHELEDLSGGLASLSA